MHTISLTLMLLTICLNNFASYCPFCDQAVLERQAFYEDEFVMALYDHRPIFPGHSLIIPKRHIERFDQLTEEEMTQIGRAIKKVNLLIPEVFHTSAYLIAEKNGLEVGQSVPHIHFHYLPRKSGESSLFYFFWRTCLAQIQKPIEPIQMKEIVDMLKTADANRPLPEEKKR